MESRFGEDQEGLKWAQKIEKEQRSEQRQRRFIAEWGGKIEERVSKLLGEMKLW